MSKPHFSVINGVWCVKVHKRQIPVKRYHPINYRYIFSVLPYEFYQKRKLALQKQNKLTWSLKSDNQH